MINLSSIAEIPDLKQNIKLAHSLSSKAITDFNRFVGSKTSDDFAVLFYTLRKLETTAKALVESADNAIENIREDETNGQTPEGETPLASAEDTSKQTPSDEDLGLGNEEQPGI